MPAASHPSHRDATPFWGLVGLALLPCAAALWQNPGDTALYATYAERMAHGLLPYRHFEAEYPPLAMALLFAVRVVVPFGVPYKIGFVLLMAAGDLMQKHALAKTFVERPLRFWLACAIGTAWLLPVYYNHFDVAPAMCCAMAMVGWMRAPNEWRGWLWLAAAIGLKAVPLVLVPVGVWICRARGARISDVAQGMSLCATLVAVPMLLAGLLCGPKAFEWWWFHQARGLHAASSYAAMAYAVHGFVAALPAQSTFGSLQLQGATAAQIAKQTPVVTASLCALPWLLWWPHRDKTEFVAGGLRLSCAMVCALLLGNKVFSPQYMAWLLPMTLALGASAKEGGSWRDTGLLLWACLCTSQLHAWERELVAGNTSRQLWLAVRLLCLGCLYVSLLAPRPPTSIAARAGVHDRLATLSLRPRTRARRQL